MKTKAFFLEGYQKYSWKEKDLTLHDDEVLVKTHQASICGTDKNLFNGLLPEKYKFPFFIGHEGGGTVVEIGPKVTRFKPGDHVMNFGLHDTFAEYFVAPSDYLEPAPEGLDFDLACLGEPIGCAMFAGMTSGVELGDTVAVFGMGFAGQIIAQVAKRKGAHTVIAIDPVPQKLKLAKELGADLTLDPTENDIVEVLADLTKGKGVDVVVEAAGNEKAMNDCSAVLKHNGIFALYSWITQPVNLNISRWHDDGFQIRSTCLVHHTIQERMIWTGWALRPVAQGLVNIKPLISHEFKLAEIGKAFLTAVNDPTALKVCLKP